jgi:NAD(P)-dependent dehydrogenase (short-subunit alcohol dehydrogenase family)
LRKSRKVGSSAITMSGPPATTANRDVEPVSRPCWQVGLNEWRRVLDVNLLGVVNGLRAFVPRLVASDEPRRVLITASLAGLVTFPQGGAYAASKHAVVAVAEQTALA